MGLWQNEHFNGMFDETIWYNVYLGGLKMFDPTKVRFSDEELNAGNSADSVYEILAEAVEDGFQFGDLAAIPAAVPHIMSLYKWLIPGTKADYAKKLIALGVMMLRDNEWLDFLEGDEE